MFASTILLSILLSVVLASPPQLSSIENEITEYAAISFSIVSTGFESIGQVSISDGFDNLAWILPGEESSTLYPFNLDSNSVVQQQKVQYSTPFEEIAAGRYSLDGVTTSNQLVKFVNGQQVAIPPSPQIKYVSNDVMNNQEQIYVISVDGNTIYKLVIGGSWVPFQRSHTWGAAKQVAVSQNNVWIVDVNNYLLRYDLGGNYIQGWINIKYIDASQRNDLWALHSNNFNLYKFELSNGWSGHTAQGLPTSIDQIEAGANYIVVVSENKLFKAPRQGFKDEEMVVIAGQPIMKVTNAYWMMVMVVIVVAMAAVIALVWQCGGNKKEYQVIEDEITPLV